MSNSNINYRHLQLKSGNILTIASYVIKYSNSLVIHYGCAVFDKRDKKFVKKHGNQLAQKRIVSSDITLVIYPDQEYTKIDHSLISLRIVDHILEIFDNFKNNIENYPCYFKQLARSTTIKSDLEQLQERLKDKILLKTIYYLNNSN